MKYGEGFWCLDKDGNRLAERAYPKLLPFEYKDGTKDRGWWLLEDFSFEYQHPRTKRLYRFTIKGAPQPTCDTAFDYDGASRPEITRAMVGDKMAHDVIVPSIGHDIGYCVHGYMTGWTQADWDLFLCEVMEVYGAGWCRRNAFWSSVRLRGHTRWPKTDDEQKHYQTLIVIQHVMPFGAD